MPRRSWSVACCLVLASVFSACSSAAPESVASPSVTSVEFKTWSVWARPYSHRVVFHADLSAEYSGLSYTQRIGEYRGAISERDWQGLIATLNSVGFDSMPTYLEQPDVSDAGSRRITVMRGTDSRYVEDYFMSGPAGWQALVRHVRDLTESVQWEPRQS